MSRNSSLLEKFPFLSRFFLFIAVPLLLMLLALAIAVSRGAPATEGSLHLAGLNTSGSIDRMEGAMPRIEAGTEHDAYFALGLLHAQERLWEMEIMRRTGAGRLSEVFGKEAYASDQIMKHVGLYTNARKAWLNLDAGNKALLQSYVDGVNAGIDNAGVLPLDYYTNGFRPEPWLAADSLVLLQLMAWHFSGNAGDELRRLLLANKYGVVVANRILGAIPAQMTDISLKGAAADDNVRIDAFMNRFTEDTPRNSIADRGWAIGGVSGALAPILAGVTLPPAALPVSWYFVEMKSDKLAIAGATLPGLPIFFHGRNARVAWTLAGAAADTQDLVLEEIDPLNRNRYKVGEAYAEMTLARETIRLKKEFLRPASRPKDILVRRTRHGVVISDLPGIPQDKVLALRWTGDDDQGGTFAALMGMNHAASWNDFDAALSTHVAPVYSILYADIDGNIAYIAPGRYPVRPTGDGKMPVPGGASHSMWQGFMAHAAIPRTINPPAGVLEIEKNALLTRPSLPAGSAGRRFPDLLAVQEHGAAGIAADAALLRMRALRPASAQQQGVVDALKQWDGRLLEHGMAPAIYMTWRARLRQAILANLAAQAPGLEPADDLVGDDLAERLMAAGGDQWCKVDERVPPRSCDGVLGRTLADALAELTALIGPDPRDWNLVSWCHAARRTGGPGSGAMPAASHFSNRPGAAAHVFAHERDATCSERGRPASTALRQVFGRHDDSAGGPWLADLGVSGLQMRAPQPAGVPGAYRGGAVQHLSLLPLNKEKR